MTHTGVIKWWDDDKGFGFIVISAELKKLHGVAEDLYVKFSQVRRADRPLMPDDVVSFKIGDEDHRTIALNVCVTRRATPQRNHHTD